MRGDRRVHCVLKEGIRKHRTAEFEDRYRKAAGPLLKTIQGMSEAIGSDGGFAVLPEYSSSIFEKVYENDLFSRTDNYTVVGNNMTFPRLNESSRANGQRAGGLQASWVGQGGSIPPTRIGLGQLALKLKKLAIVVYLADELVDDSGIALEQYVTRKVTQEFNFMVGDAIVEGTGGGQPQGILSSGALLTVAKESGQAAATLVKENIDKMYSRLGRKRPQRRLAHQPGRLAGDLLAEPIARQQRLPDVHPARRLQRRAAWHPAGPPHPAGRVLLDARGRKGT